MFQKYHVLSLLGSGGSSSVYLAEHLTLKQYRAVKCIPKTLAREAFGHSEASLLKNLRHPGIPMIYDTEEDDSYFYIIEEYIQGESMSAFVQNQNNISQETIISFGIQLCEIIEYLHYQKPNPILYLDLKPEHIILCGKQLKLIDFSIATALGEDGNQFQSYGTSGFAAPEQYIGRACREQTDVYGIGAVLYYMLTRELLPPNSATSFAFPRYCSAGFKKIILKAVDPCMEHRYSQVEQLRKALQKASSWRTGSQPGAHLLQKIIVTGSQERAGTTHTAIGLVSWLNRGGVQAFYEAKAKDPLPQLLSYKDGAVRMNGVCMYRDFQALMTPEAAKQTEKPHILVQDYGTDLASVAEKEDADLVLLVMGSRPWELEAGIHSFEMLSGEENIILICNYNDKQAAKKYARVFQKKVFCFPLDADPFALTREKQRLFDEIFKERRKRPYG